MNFQIQGQLPCVHKSTCVGCRKHMSVVIFVSTKMIKSTNIYLCEYDGLLSFQVTIYMMNVYVLYDNE